MMLPLASTMSSKVYPHLKSHPIIPVPNPYPYPSTLTLMKVRVLDADKFKQTQELEQECTQFVNSTFSCPGPSPGPGPLSLALSPFVSPVLPPNGFSHLVFFSSCYLKPCRDSSASHYPSLTDP
jgi:hypothetical protein